MVRLLQIKLTNMTMGYSVHKVFRVSRFKEIHISRGYRQPTLMQELVVASTTQTWDLLVYGKNFIVVLKGSNMWPIAHTNLTTIKKNL